MRKLLKLLGLSGMAFGGYYLFKNKEKVDKTIEDIVSDLDERVKLFDEDDTDLTFNGENEDEQ